MSPLKKEFSIKKSSTDHLFSLLEKVKQDDNDIPNIKLEKKGDDVFCHFLKTSDAKAFIKTHLAKTLAYGKSEAEQENILEKNQHHFKIRPRKDGYIESEKTLTFPLNIFNADTLLAAEYDDYVFDRLKSIRFEGKYDPNQLQWERDGHYAVAHFMDQTDLEIFMNIYVTRALNSPSDAAIEKEELMDMHADKFIIEFRDNGQQGEKTLKIPLSYLDSGTLDTLVFKSHKIDTLDLQERPNL